MAMLEVSNLGISFGGLRAVDNFNLSLEKGALYGLIGPNGAGKTTVFNLLTGVYKPTNGTFFLDGQELKGKKPADINNAGIARTFQNIRLFKDLSVLDNVKVGLHNGMKYSTVAGIFRLPAFFKTEKIMDEPYREVCLDMRNTCAPPCTVSSYLPSVTPPFLKTGSGRDAPRPDSLDKIRRCGICQCGFV